MYSRISGTGSGIAPVVNLTFPFADKAHVKASVAGVDATFTWTGASQITFSSAVPNGVEWVVYRDTSPAAKLVDFVDTAVLTEDDLDLQATQAHYREQELDDRLSIAQGTGDAAQETADSALALAEDVQSSLASVPNATAHAATRAILAGLSTTSPAYLAEPGYEGEFVFDSSNLSAQVAIDTLKGIFVPPTGQDGSAGAWRRKFDGHPSVKWFGVAGGGVVEDGAALVTATTKIAALGYTSAIIPPGVYKASTTVAISASNLKILSHGAKITSPITTTIPLIQLDGDGIQIIGLDTELTAAVTTAHHYRLNGDNCRTVLCNMAYTADQDTPAYYIRGANGAVVTNCTKRGSNAFMGYIEGNDLLIADNYIYGIPGGSGDDAMAIKAINQSSENIIVRHNHVFNHASICALGSNIGAQTDVATTLGVRGVSIVNNVGYACGGICTIRPGGTTGQPYYNGEVCDVDVSGNILRDPDGISFSQAIRFAPGKGSNVHHISGRGNIVEARAFGSSLDAVIAIIRGDAGVGGTPTIADVKVEVIHNDRNNGVAAGTAGVNGSPVQSFFRVDPAGLNLARITCTGKGNGFSIMGVYVGPGADGAVTIGDLELTSYNVTASGAAGGIRVASKVYVPDHHKVVMSGTGEPYVVDAGGQIIFRKPYEIARGTVAIPHTGDTVLSTLQTVTIPKGLIGPKGYVEIRALWSGNDATDNKNARILFGGNNVLNMTSVGIAGETSVRVYNRNATNAQVTHPVGVAGDAITTTGVPNTFAVDTTAAVAVDFKGSVSLNTDIINLDAYVVTVHSGE